MALSPSHLTTDVDTVSRTSYQTASISPSANTLVLAAVHAFREAGLPSQPTLSGNGLTWVPVTAISFSTLQERLFLFRALKSSPTSGVVTIDFGAESQTTCEWSIAEIAGADTKGTDGERAVVQFATGSGTGTTALATLAAFLKADNIAFGAFASASSRVFTEGSGFSILGQIASGAAGSIATEANSGQDTTVDATLSSDSWVAIGVEISDNGPVTIERSVAASADDASEAGTTVVIDGTTTANDLDATTDWAGFRFTNITIPKGSTIRTAKLSVVPTATGTDEPLVTVFVEDADNAAAFSTGASNISNRSRTAGVAWSSTNLGADGATYFDSPDFASDLQSVIDRSGWSSGNAIAIIIQGGSTANRDLRVFCYDNGSLIPRLTIKYSIPAISLAGAQPAPSGAIEAATGVTPVSVAGAQPAPTGAIAKKYLIALAGSQPAAHGVVTSGLKGIQPAPSGTLTVTRFYVVALAGAQPAPDGDLVVLSSKALDGAQPAATGGLSTVASIALSGAQPAPSGALAARQTLNVSLSGAQPTATGEIDAIALFAVSLDGTQPSATGTVLLVYLIALNGAQPAPDGDIVASQAIELDGAQPAATGELAAVSLIVVALDGSQPAATGGLALSATIALSGSQPQPTGSLAILQTLAISLSGAQPAPTGTLDAQTEGNVTLSGVQPFATGALSFVAFIGLSGAQPAPSGTAAVLIFAALAGLQPSPTATLASPPTITGVVPDTFMVGTTGIVISGYNFGVCV